MKTKTEIILEVLKYLALIAAIGFSIEGGAYLLSFVASFINPDWAGKTYLAEPVWFEIRAKSLWYYVQLMSIIIFIAAIKAWIWYLIFDLLLKIQLRSPFSLFVTKRLESISYFLFSVWLITTLVGKSYSHYLMKDTGIEIAGKFMNDEYILIAGIVYILSQIIKRGIEMQEENQLTV